jgi:hypothetical protein
MGRGFRFAGRFTSVEETPGPFRHVLLERIWPQESVRLLVHSPPDLISGTRRPGTLLAVTDRRWLIVYENADESTTVAESSFTDTLLVELTTILLYGQLSVRRQRKWHNQGLGAREGFSVRSAPSGLGIPWF